MILANDRVNNEFYTCPTYNHLLSHDDDATVVVFHVDNMQGIGTPEDLKQWGKLELGESWLRIFRL